MGSYEPIEPPVTEPLILVMPFLLTSVVTKSCLQIHLIRDLIPSCNQNRITSSFSTSKGFSVMGTTPGPTLPQNFFVQPFETAK